MGLEVELEKNRYSSLQPQSGLPLFSLSGAGDSRPNGRGIRCRYTAKLYRSLRKTDIEHVVALSEAHDSGLCATDAATKRR